MLDRYDQDLLLDYLEGELDAEQRAQLDKMLAEDPQLAALLAEMAKDRAALRSLPQAEAPGDLVHDVTQTLERRMLLDDSVDDTTPIPISRAMAGEPTRSISWGRVVGLTGLAASVALAAGILVITFDDTLQRTANEFADNIGAEAEDAAVESGAVAESADAPVQPEGVALLDKPDRTNGLPTPGINTPPADVVAEALENGIDAARAHAGGLPNLPDSTPGAGAAPGTGNEGAGEPPIETLAFGSTAAISVMQPRKQLVLLSDSPEASLEQLLEFCVANGIPVVQPDQQVNLAQARQPRLDADPGAVLDNTTADAGADAPFADYALLINEQQLDTLVQSLNNDITPDPKRVDKGSLFSNQAALLEDLPESAYQSRVADPRANEDEAELADQAAGIESAEVLLEQQAVQLRSPDLGSDYANQRNSYNLLAQQQAGYGQKERAVADTQSSGDRESDVAKPTAQGVAPEAKPGQTEADQVEPKDQAPRAVTPAADANSGDAGDEDKLIEDAPQIEEEHHDRRIDPLRGNWLSAHLPVADTTPLLLSWRQGQAIQPTKLVPVKIQRAEAEKVNTLRSRQQNEYANRSNNIAAEAEANDAVERIETQPAEIETPAEAKPAEPAE